MFSRRLPKTLSLLQESLGRRPCFGEEFSLSSRATIVSARLKICSLTRAEDGSTQELGRNSSMYRGRIHGGKGRRNGNDRRGFAAKGVTLNAQLVTAAEHFLCRSCYCFNRTHYCQAKTREQQVEGHWKENSGVTPVPHSGGGNNLAAYILRLQVLLKKKRQKCFSRS